jgi:hypothetical protein
MHEVEFFIPTRCISSPDEYELDGVNPGRSFVGEFIAAKLLDEYRAGRIIPDTD